MPVNFSGILNFQGVVLIRVRRYELGIVGQEREEVERRFWNFVLHLENTVYQ